jgi:hypothetical protein
LTADATGTYTVSMTPRAGAYDGPSMGTSSVTVGLTPGTRTPVNFDFTPAAVTPGTVVTFSMTQLTPAAEPGALVFYHVGTCTFDEACVTPSPFKETEGTTPPLDSIRRNGVSAIIFDTRPLPPPVFLARDGS